MTVWSRPPPHCWNVVGPCDPPALARLLAQASGAPIPWERVDLRGRPADWDGELARLAWQLANSPPDDGSPLRAVLARHRPEHHVLLVAESPAAMASGWTEALFGLPAPQAVTAEDERYWRDQLAGVIGGEPPWRCRKPIATGGPAHVDVPLEPELARRLAAAAGVAVADVVAAAAVALLARYGRQRDLLFGSVLGAGFGDGAAARVLPRPELLPVRVDVAGDLPFADLLVRVGAARRQAAARRPCRVAATTAIPVTVAARGASSRARELGPALATPLPVPRPAPGPGLWLEVEEDRTTCWYDSGRAVPAHVERFTRHLVVLLREAEAQPRQPLRRLRALDPAERARLLADANSTAVTYADSSPVPGRVLGWARRRPHAPAVVAGGTTLTYGELAARAAGLAARLRVVGVGPDVLVGLWLPRSTDLVVAALAVLLAGGAHVAFDSTEPARRVTAALADAGAPVLVTRTWRQASDSGNRGGTEAGRGLRPPRPPVVIDLDTPVPPAVPEQASAVPSDLCYVSYTSGSTGVPKGVLVQHEGVSNLASWHAAEFAVRPGDHLPQLASPSSDEWCLEVWPCLAAGATLEVAHDGVAESPEALLRWLHERRIAVAYLPTGLAVELLHRPWPPDTALRALLVGGEKLYGHVPDGLPFRVCHVYGRPETSTLATCGDVVPGDVSPPIGWPLPNTRVYVLDEGGEPVPPGAVGELHIGGACVARGYLGRPAPRPSQFSDDLAAGGRRYATGDLVRRLDDGALELVGRIENKIKLRGFHIEPGQVEAALRRDGAVRDAVVVVHDGRVLVAYVTPRDAARPPDAGELRRELADLLPAFMVPHAVVPLDAFPLTPHGEVDRRALARRRPVEQDGAAVPSQRRQAVRAPDPTGGHP